MRSKLGKDGRRVFSDIVSTLNKSAIDLLMERSVVRMPYDMLFMYIEDREYKPKYIDGKIVGAPPVDWGTTMKMRRRGVNITVRQEWKKKLILRSKKSLRNRKIAKPYKFDYYRGTKKILSDNEDSIRRKRVRGY